MCHTMLYEYVDAGCERDYLHTPVSEWEKWDNSLFVPALITVYLGTMDKRLCKSVSDTVKIVNQKYSEQNVYYLDLPLQDENDGLGVNWHPTEKTHRKAACFVENRIKDILSGNGKSDEIL